MHPVYCLCVISSVLVGEDAGDRTDPAIGRQISDFRLPDAEGRPYQLDDCRDARLVVVAFVGLGSPLKPERPTRVDGVKVGMQFTKLHILQATEFGEGPEGTDRHVPDLTRIGEYTVHYADDTTETIPIIYGEDVRDWWFNDRSKGTTRGKVAWKGTNAYASSLGSKVRLYMTTWQNPKPGVRVTHVDFSSSQTAAAPFCVAISAETP